MICIKSTYFKSNTKQIFIVLALILVKSNLAFSYTLKEYAEKPFGNVLFIRHAMAPGYGDPQHFVLNDCSTQRNLNNDGRIQAVEIGKIIKNEGINFLKIYSSQWCRCIETARLTGLGKITIEPGLNSFFQGFVSKEQTLTKLQKILKSLEDSNDLVLMVTHQVTITAITGISVSSGGAVAFSTRFRKSKEVKIIN